MSAKNSNNDTYKKIIEIFVKNNDSIQHYKNHVDKMLESVKILSDILKYNINKDSLKTQLQTSIDKIIEIKNKIDNEDKDITINIDDLQNINYCTLKTQTYKLLQNIIDIITEKDDDKKETKNIVKNIYSTLFQYMIGDILKYIITKTLDDNIAVNSVTEIREQALNMVKETYRDKQEYIIFDYITVSAEEKSPFPITFDKSAIKKLREANISADQVGQLIRNILLEVKQKEKELKKNMTQNIDIRSILEKYKLTGVLSKFTTCSLYNMYGTIISSLLFDNIYNDMITMGDVTYVEKHKATTEALNNKYISSMQNFINTDFNSSFDADLLVSLFDKQDRYIDIIDRCINRLCLKCFSNKSILNIRDSIKEKILNKSITEKIDYNNIEQMKKLLHSTFDEYYGKYISDISEQLQDNELPNEINQKYIKNKSTFLVITILRFINKYLNYENSYKNKNDNIMNMQIVFLVILYNMIVDYIFPQHTVYSSGYCAFYADIVIRNMYRYKIYNIVKDIKNNKYDEKFITEFKEHCIDDTTLNKCLSDTIEDIDIRKCIALNTVANTHDFFKVRHYFWSKVFDNKKESILFNYYTKDYNNIYNNNVYKDFAINEKDNRFNYKNVLDFICDNFGIFATWVYDNDESNDISNYINKTARISYNIWLYTSIILTQKFIITKYEKNTILENDPQYELSKHLEAADEIYDNRLIFYFYENGYILDSHFFNKYINIVLSTKIIDILLNKFSYKEYNKTRMNNILIKIKDSIKYLNTEEDTDSVIKEYEQIDGEFNKNLIRPCMDITILFKLYKLMEYNYLYPYYKESIIEKIEYIKAARNDYKNKENFTHSISAKEILDGSVVLPEYDKQYVMYTDTINKYFGGGKKASRKKREKRNKNKNDTKQNIEIYDDNEDRVWWNTIDSFEDQSINKSDNDYENISITVNDLLSIVDKNNDPEMFNILSRYQNNDIILNMKLHKKFIFLIFLLLFSYTISFSKLYDSAPKTLFDLSFSRFKAIIVCNDIDKDECVEHFYNDSEIINDSSLIKKLYKIYYNDIADLINKTNNDYNNKDDFNKTMDYIEKQINENIFKELDEHIDKYIRKNDYNGDIRNPYAFLNTMFVEKIQHNSMLNVYSICDKYNINRYEAFDIINGTYILQKIINILGIYTFDNIISNIKPPYEPIHKIALWIDDEYVSVDYFSPAVYYYGFHALATYYDDNSKYITFDSNFNMNYTEEKQTMNNFGSICIITENVSSLVNSFPFLQYKFSKTAELIKDHIYKNKYVIDNANKFLGGKNKTIHIIAIIAFVLLLIVFVIAIIVIFIIAIKKEQTSGL